MKYSQFSISSFWGGLRRYGVGLWLCVTVICAGSTAAAAPALPAPDVLPFVANAGQIADARVAFYTRTFAGPAFVRHDGTIAYMLVERSAGRRAVLIEEKLLDARYPAPTVAEPSAARFNFFRGAPDAWRADVPGFFALSFPDVYAGIHLSLRARPGNIEKIFTVAPGADPAQIRVKLSGVDALQVNDAGELAAATALGTIRFTKPVAWQLVPDAGGAAERRSVAIAYALADETVFSFRVGAYDPALPLVIDPMLAGTFVGGSAADVLTAVAVAPDGSNVFAVGYTASSDFEFPASAGTITNYQGGDYDVLVVKFDAQLTNLAAATFLGGSSNDQGLAIAFNTNNNCVYVGGLTDSTNFTGGVANRGGQDGFVARLDANLGNPLAVLLGGVSNDAVRALVAHGSQIYAAGETGSSNLNFVSAGSLQQQLLGLTNAFLAVLDPSFDANFCSATYLGGSVVDAATALAFDNGNNIILCGYTYSTNFPTNNTYGANSAQTNLRGACDAFVAKFSEDASALLAASYLGGTNIDRAAAVVVDISNNIYVAGGTLSTNFPTNNIFGTSYCRFAIGASNGASDAFVTRFSPELTNFQASTYLAGSSNDAIAALGIVSDTNATVVFLAGYTYSADFPVTSNVFDRTYNGAGDAFIARFEDTLTNLLNASYVGGSGSDAAMTLAFAADANSFYIAGGTASTNFPVSGGAHRAEYGGGASDGFLARMGATMQYGGLKWMHDFYESADTIVGSPAMGWDGTIYIGCTSNLMAFNPDGTLKWNIALAGKTVFNSPPYYGHGPAPVVDTNGNVYIGASAGLGGQSWLYSIRGDTGQTNWVIPLEGQISGSPALGLDGSIYVGTYSKHLYAIAPNGATNWDFPGTVGWDDNFAAAPAVGTNGRVYAISRWGTSAALYALDATNGSKCWDYLFTGSSDLGGYAAPMLASNGLIFAPIGTNLYAFRDAGSSGDVFGVWAVPAKIFSSPAIDSNGMVYVGSGDCLYSFDSRYAGATNWSLPVDGGITSSPAVGADGLIYFGSRSNIYAVTAGGQTSWVLRVAVDGAEITYHSPIIGTDGTVYMSDIWTLYAIYGAVPPDQNSAWPMFHRDVLHTGNAGFDPRRYTAPTGVTASKGTYTNRVTVSWNAIPNVVYYEVYRSTTNNPLTASRIKLLSRTNFTDTAIAPGQIYYYWLRARTQVVTLSDFSEGDFGGTPPLPPADLIASKGVPSNYVQVVWQPSDFAATYDLYRSFDNDTGTAVYVTTVATTNYDDHEATNYPGRTHYYWVKALNAVGYASAFSSGDGVTNAGGIPPAIPRNLTAGKGLTSTNVPLNWSPVDYAAAYVVYRHTESNDPNLATAVGIAASTNYNDPGAVPFKPYYYWVRATNQYGLSDYSAPDFGYTVLLPPLSVTASVNQTNRVVVTWQIESTNANSYLLYRGETTNPAEAVFVVETAYSSPSATNYTDFGVVRGNEYYYFLRARNLYGTSDYSPPSNLGGTFPLAPTEVEATDGTEVDFIRVVWAASASPTVRGYGVYRATQADPNYAVLIGTVAGGLSFDDTGSEPGQRYYYWIVATNRLGPSPFSGVNSGWRPLSAPASISASYGSSTSEVTVTWSASRNATAYEVWRNTENNSNSAEKLHNTWPSTTYSDTAAEIGRIYYYWVKAKNSHFVSDFSRSAAGFRALGDVDLSADLLLVRPNVLVPETSPQALSFRISNLGPNNMTEPNSWVTADFYLSSSSVFVESNAYWLGGLDLNLPMSAGAGRSYTLTAAQLAALSVPQIPAGSYYLFLYVRHVLPSMWSDPNLANNYVRRSGDVVLVNQTGAARQPWHDYDGDGRADPAVYRAADGCWRAWLSGSSYAEVSASGMGGVGFMPVPADYDGDSKTDPAVYRAADGCWQAWLSGSSYAGASATGLGGADFVPVPADYDGDGKADPAVYRAADGRWRVWLSGNHYAEVSVAGMGGSTAQAATGGYDYDFKADPAVFYPSSGFWRIWLSGNGYAENQITAWGSSGFMFVPGDYTGDGLTDLAIYHVQSGYWFIRTFGGDQVLWGVLWGGEGFYPVPGDFDGNGAMDLAVYDAASGAWYVRTVGGSVLAAGVILGGADFLPAGMVY